MLVILLLILGLACGSFVSALTWRIHDNKNWVTGRSECLSCGHKLAPQDLIPVFSWLMLRGRCRYCKQPISKQEPLIEILSAAWFVGSYLFWPLSLNAPGQKIVFASWLLTSVGLLALLVYDRRWMILPTKIIYSSLFFAALGRLIYIVGYSPAKSHAALDWLLSILVASGIFFIIHEISKGQWIGFGDVRLGLVTGTVLAAADKSFLMIFIASALGTLFFLLTRIKTKEAFNSRLPYGPFLIIATALSLLFGTRLIDWYTGLFS